MDCDLIVVGSGAGGLAAAITAARKGLAVVVAEKTAFFGGTTAYSGGFQWIPGNPIAVANGVTDSVEEARRYIAALAGKFFDPERVDAYLAAGPEMIGFFTQEMGLHLQYANATADYHSETPGAVRTGRSLFPAPVHASILEDAYVRLRPPLPEAAFLGLRIGLGADLQHFLNVTSSWRSAAYVAGRMLRHGYELLRYGRGMQLVNGNSLVAQLGAIAQREGVTILYDSPVVELIRQGGEVAGAVLGGSRNPRRITARKGVVLAAGGFPWDLARRARLYPHPAGGNAHFSLAPPTNEGDGIRLAEEAGGSVTTTANNGAWMPVSRLPKRHGPDRTVMHSFLACKPGVIAVTPEGKRFVNESIPWQDYCEAMLTARGPGLPAQAFLIADHRAIRAYGLGFVKPAPVPMIGHLRSGYLMKGRTIAELAAVAGIDGDALQATVAAFNGYARIGHDPEFQRGETRYSRSLGDRRIGPNPTLAPVEQGPFYAVRLFPGDVGTLAGLRTDGKARVLGADGAPVPRLYAAGNDAATIFGGAYPGGGCTIGPAMTFGFIAGRDAAALPDLDGGQ